MSADSPSVCPHGVALLLEVRARGRIRGGLVERERVAILCGAHRMTVREDCEWLAGLAHHGGAHRSNMAERA